MQYLTRAPASQGFTLLEVLIAILVFSIGLLGLAGLQVSGLKLSHDSLLRGIATIKANDMADRMRTNSAVFDLGAASPYNNPTSAKTGSPNCLGKDSLGNDVNVQCTATQMAQNDFYEWYAQLKGQAATSWHPQVLPALPSGDGVVCVDSTPNDGTPAAPACDGVIAVTNAPIFAIKIWWREREDEASPGTLHRFVMSLSP